ncbi:MAG: PilZ domain-containing protein [Phycisphaerales bacterium]|nr:PilZ domain-containing protein [Phycisphaerales bacterium]
MLLQALDTTLSKRTGINRRKFPRFPYQIPTGMQVEFVRAGESQNKFVVWPRNVSRFGVGFIHGTFVYNDTTARIDLRTLDHQPVRVEGKVVQCRHIRGRVHEIGIEFEEPILVEQFVPVETLRALSPAGALNVSRSLADLLSMSETEACSDNIRAKILEVVRLVAGSPSTHSGVQAR